MSSMQSTNLQQKCKAVKKNLELERMSLREVRFELQNGLSQMSNDLVTGLTSLSAALNQKDQDMHVMKSDLQLKLYQYTALERRADSEKENFNKQLENMIAKGDSLESQRASDMTALQKQLENGNKERLLLSKQNAKSQAELKSCLLESQTVKDLCVQLQQDLVIKSLASNTAISNYQKESEEKHALLKEREGLNEMIHKGINQLKVTNEELKQEREKVKVLTTAKEALQADLKYLQSSSKKEVGLSNADKHDMQGKLYGIQEKVKSIEDEHSFEMSGLKARILEVERERDIMANLKFKSIQMNLELENQIKELTVVNKDLLLQLSMSQDRNVFLEQNGTIQNDKLLKELTLSKKEIDEIELSRETLRADREAADKKSHACSQKSIETEGLLFAALQEVDSLKVSLEKAATVEASRTSNESKDIKELRKSLLLAQQTATERETEVFGLKEIVREEVVVKEQKVILIEDLYEQIKVLQEYQISQDEINRKNKELLQKYQECPVMEISIPQEISPAESLPRSKFASPMRSPPRPPLQLPLPQPPSPEPEREPEPEPVVEPEVESPQPFRLQARSTPLIQIQNSGAHARKRSIIVNREREVIISSFETGSVLPLHANGKNQNGFNENPFTEDGMTWGQQMNRKPSTNKAHRKLPS